MVVKSTIQQWPAIDMDFVTELSDIQHGIIRGIRSEAEFDQKVMDNRDKINTPLYLHVFATGIRTHEEYFRKHEGFCRVIYDFITNNPNWRETGLGPAATMRFHRFTDNFQNYLEQKGEWI